LKYLLSRRIHFEQCFRNNRAEQFFPSFLFQFFDWSNNLVPAFPNLEMSNLLHAKLLYLIKAENRVLTFSFFHISLSFLIFFTLTSSLKFFKKYENVFVIAFFICFNFFLCNFQCKSTDFFFKIFKFKLSLIGKKN
jgi:hypothetical protein